MALSPQGYNITEDPKNTNPFWDSDDSGLSEYTGTEGQILEFNESGELEVSNSLIELKNKVSNVSDSADDSAAGLVAVFKVLDNFSGGSTSQVLTKNSDTAFDFIWKTPEASTSGGSTVYGWGTQKLLRHIPNLSAKFKSDQVIDSTLQKPSDTSVQSFVSATYMPVFPLSRYSGDNDSYGDLEDIGGCPIYSQPVSFDDRSQTIKFTINQVKDDWLIYEGYLYAILSSNTTSGTVFTIQSGYVNAINLKTQDNATFYLGYGNSEMDNGKIFLFDELVYERV